MSKKMRIAVLDDYQGAALRSADWTALERVADVEVFRDTLTDQGALVDRLQPFEVVCAMRERTRFPQALIERLPNLRLIASTGPNNAAIDLAAAEKHGVLVCGTSGWASAAPELTWALILAAVRHLPDEFSSMRDGRWQTQIGKDLRGKTLGLLGLGTTGSAVAKVGAAFGMSVIAWSANLSDEVARKNGAERVAFDELLERADIVSVHLRLSSRTENLVDEHAIAQMKHGAILVNTSRAPIVNEQALVNALETGRLSAAAQDVYTQEPLPPEHALRTTNRLILTPHIGYVTEETFRLYYGETVENIQAWLDGVPRRLLTPQAPELKGVYR